MTTTRLEYAGKPVDGVIGTAAAGHVQPNAPTRQTTRQEWAQLNQGPRFSEEVHTPDLSPQTSGDPAGGSSAKALTKSVT